MFGSTRQVLVLAASSGVLAGALYWWWGRLVAGTFAQCVGGTPAAGLDCRHSIQLYAAIVFAAVSLVLLLLAVVPSVRSGQRRAV